MSDQQVFVSFGGNTSELEAALARASAELTRFQRELANVAREQAKAGASASVELGEKMLEAAQKVVKARDNLRSLRAEADNLAGGSLKSAAADVNKLHTEVAKLGEASAHGHGTGLGFFVREAHALLDELGSGRDRQAVGTFSNLAFTFLQGNAALIPYVAAVAAVGAALGVIAYKAYEASAAVKNIRLDAAANQFQLSAEAATRVKDSIQSLGDVSASAAEEIAKPFAAMGPIGETVAQLMTPAIAKLAQSLKGDTAKAAEELAKRFVDLDGAGRRYVESARDMTSDEKARFAQLVNSGHQTQALSMLIDASSRSLMGLVAADKQAADAAGIHQMAMVASTNLGISLEEAERRIAASFAETTGATDQQSSALSRLSQALLAANTSAQTFASGISAALKVDKLSAEIKSTEGEIDRLSAGIEAAGDKSSPAIDQMSRALDIARDHMKKLREESADGLLSRDALQQLQRANEALGQGHKGPESDLLRQQRDSLQNFAADPSHSAGERDSAAQQAAAKTAELTRAEYQEFIEGEELKLAAAKKNSAAIVAVHQEEVARAIAVYGQGSREAQQQQIALAHAIESAASAGDKAGTKAAHEQLAATEEGLSAQIAGLERHTQTYIEHLDAEVKSKRLTEAEKLAAALEAIGKESAAVEALYAKELAIAGLTAQKKQEIEDKEVAFEDATTRKILELQDGAARAAIEAWDKASKSVESALDSQIGPLLKGAETARQAFQKMAADIAESMIKSGVNKLFEGGVNLVGGALGVGVGAAGGAAGAASSAANTTAIGVLTAALNANTLAIGGTIPPTIANTAASAANTGAQAANTSATSASVGVHIASAAATDGLQAATAPNTVATLGNTIATNAAAIAHFLIPGFATGTPFVEDTGLALIHQGEAIIPAARNPFGDIGAPSFDALDRLRRASAVGGGQSAVGASAPILAALQNPFATGAVSSPALEGLRSAASAAASSPALEGLRSAASAAAPSAAALASPALAALQNRFGAGAASSPALEGLRSAASAAASSPALEGLRSAASAAASSPALEGLRSAASAAAPSAAALASPALAALQNRFGAGAASSPTAPTSSAAASPFASPALQNPFSAAAASSPALEGLRSAASAAASSAAALASPALAALQNPFGATAASSPALEGLRSAASAASRTSSAALGWRVPDDVVAHARSQGQSLGASLPSAAEALPGLAAPAQGRGDAQGGRGVTVHAPVNIHSMDSSTVAATLHANGGALLKSLRNAVRSGAHLHLK